LGTVILLLLGGGGGLFIIWLWALWTRASFLWWMWGGPLQLYLLFSFSFTLRFPDSLKGEICWHLPANPVMTEMTENIGVVELKVLLPSTSPST
jgi:hypothetical protein